VTAILTVQPSLLGKINERHVLRILQQCGPLSRAEVARQTGLSPPTVSKAAISLLRTGLLEEYETPDNSRGRPAKKLRLACESTCVLGIVIDAETCQVVSAGLDGKLQADREVSFPTPDSYDQLLNVVTETAQAVLERSEVTTLGVGLSIPGLIDYRRQLSVLSPNVPQTNGHTPALDLQERLGVDCVMVQECHGLCLAERHYGLAQELDDFAMLEVGTGVGLGVMSGGTLLTGHNGLAGEIGHITVADNGRPCGCGNRGCLETVASDSALAWRVSRKLGRRVNIEKLIELCQSGKIAIAEEIEDNARCLSIGMAAVINLFNPATLFVHGRQFETDPAFFARLVELTCERTLPPSYAECQIVEARGSKKQGAVAAVIQHLTSSIAPALAAPVSFLVRRR
jgi:predicted NBD/HSP70 family sugar kinase